MTIRLVVCKRARRDAEVSGKDRAKFVLTEKEQARFRVFGQAMTKEFKKASLAEHISFIRLYPEHASLGGDFQRNTTGIGVAIVVGVYFGRGKKPCVKKFERRYWGNPMQEHCVEVPHKDRDLPYEVTYAFEKIVASALAHHQKTVKPATELSRVLSSLRT